MKPEVYYLANAGVYIKTKEHGILIDGIYEGYEGFDPMPADIHASIVNKSEPFDNLDLMLFTHCHPDHYSIPDVRKLAKENPELLLYYPEMESLDGLPNPERTLVKYRLPDSEKVVAALGLPNSENALTRLGASEHSGKATTELTADGLINVIMIPAKHIMAQYSDYPHEALIIRIKSEDEVFTYLFTGDADSTDQTAKEALLAELEKASHLTAFINPFYFFLTQGMKALTAMGVEKTYIYHLPIVAEDINKYHDMVTRGMKRAKGLEAVPLMEHFVKL